MAHSHDTPQRLISTELPLTSGEGEEPPTFPKRSVYRSIRVSMLAVGGASGIVFPVLVGHVLLGGDNAASVLYTIVCTIACVAVGIVNYWLFNRYVSAELHRIVEAMQRINHAVVVASEAGGDLTGNHRLQITSNDDIGALEHSFNEMTGAIAKRLNVERCTRRLQHQLSSSNDAREAGGSVLDELCAAAGATGGALFALSDGSLSRVAVTGLDETSDMPRGLDHSDGPTKYAQRNDDIVELSTEEHGLEWVRMSTPFGALRPENVLIVPLHANEELVGVAYLASSLRRITPAQHELLDALRQRAAHQLQNILLHEKVRRVAALDELTGLFNRRFGLRRMEEEFSLALRHGTPFSVIMLDIDHFKAINDSFGHDAGDAVLKMFSKTLEQTLRASDVVCRYGGEEFLIGAAGADIQNVGRLAERIRTAVAAERVTWRGTVLRVTTSVGTATWPASRASSPGELVTDADHALYEAKNAGRNRVATSNGEGVIIHAAEAEAA